MTNVSSPTQANNVTRATNGNSPTRPLYVPKSYIDTQWDEEVEVEGRTFNERQTRTKLLPLVTMLIND